MNPKKLLDRHVEFIRQFFRYFFVALAGYVIDFGSLVLLVEVLHVHYLIGASTGFTLGLIATYLLSRRFVFGTSKLTSKNAEFALFAIIGLVGLVLLNVFMWIFTDLFGITYIFSKIVATAFVYLWNFFARRTLYHNEV